MPINFSNDKPIFLQLAELIKSEIISGKHPTGKKLPSVREFAFEFQINPNTVQKALQILEEEGYIITLPKKGAYVKGAEDTDTADIENTDNEIRVRELISSLKTGGCDKETLLRIVEEVYKW